MVLWLRKAFIRDYDNLNDPKVRSAHGKLSSWLGIVLNAILVSLKLSSAFYLAAMGGWVFSLALVGDAVNNLFDFTSSILSLVGFAITSKPADSEHPYGHGRAEYIAGMLIGVAIIASGGMLLFRSAQGILLAEEVSYDLFAYIALSATLPIKGIQCYVNMRLGKLLHSPTLKAVGMDALFDVALSTLLLLGAAISAWTKLGSLDAYLGALVSLFLIYAGARALKEAGDPLLGETLPAELEAQVKEIVFADPRVKGVHDFLCHSYGEGVRYISFHMELDGSLSLQKAHEIVDEMEEKVALRTHSEVLIHPDPVDLNNPELHHVEVEIEAVLQRFPEVSFHDLHVKEVEGKETYCFDVLLPFGYEEEKMAELKRELGSLSVATLVHYDHPYS